MTRYYPAPTPPPETQREEKKPETTAPTPPKPEPALQTAKPTTSAGAKPRPVQEVKVETDDYVALFTSQGARLKSFKLKHYRTSADEKSPPFEMVPSVPGVPYPLGVTLAGSNPSDDENIAYAIQGGDLKLAGTSEGRLVFQGTSPAGVALTKELTFTGSGYSIRMQVSAGDAAAAPGLTITAEAAAKTPADAPFEGMLADVDGKLVREHGDSLKGKEWSGKVSWAGFGHTYFLFAVLPEGSGVQKITVREAGPALVMEIAPWAAAAQATHTLFIGPKEIETLKSIGRGLERSIDFGWFHLVSVPLLYILHFFHNFTGSWGMDIILLTVLIKLIMAPLTHKSFVSMKQMQKLQPQMERLKEKHKDNKEALNKEIMELYRRNKVNPFGGCLPMLLQFPVFIALYNALLTPIELRHAPFLWIKDLSRPDWESLPVEMFGFQFGIPILTLLMGASMFVQQWMTPTAGDPNQRRMMLMMPIVFTFMFINFPSGLTIYWLVNNLLSIAQQYLINRSQH
jgi:YidC/Oxa1 family membrane protein insertase